MIMKPIKVGQKIFREWCAAHGACVDVAMAADLVRRIEAAIIEERKALTFAIAAHDGQVEDKMHIANELVKALNGKRSAT